MADELLLDGHNLTIEDVERVSFGKTLVALAPECVARLRSTRDYIDKNWLHDSAPLIYSFNTGVGNLKSQRIPASEITRFQSNIVRAHAAGCGEPFPRSIVRAMILLRANAFASDYSGPRVELVQRLLDMLNRQVHPVVYSKGSVGASGDLAPLAYISAALMGDPAASVELNDQVLSAPEALAAAGLEPSFPYQAKDAVALLNGSTASLAVLCQAYSIAKQLIAYADLSAALSIEAIRGELDAFDKRIHIARPHPGQIKSAESLRGYLRGSQRCTEESRRKIMCGPDAGKTADLPPRVQDVYSYRCTPQVHGPVHDALQYVHQILQVEMNSATDNPLIFRVGEDYIALSGGNFHGQYLAQAADLLAIAMTDLSSICERRLARLIDPVMSLGMPSNLVAVDPGINTGYSVVSCSMAALVMENRTLSMPASVDSISAKGNAEDHVSNSTWAARKALQIVENTKQVIGVELLIANQAIGLTQASLQSPVLGSGTQRAYNWIQNKLPTSTADDRYMHDDIALCRNWLDSDDLLKAAAGD
jgi:histidine ammonia-lyase